LHAIGKSCYDEYTKRAGQFARSKEEACMTIRSAQHYLATLPQAVFDYAAPGQQLYALPDAYTLCRAMTRHHSKSFFLATRLLPPPKRRAMEAFYAFCRSSDDAVDMSADGAGTLARWVALVQHPTPPADQPVLLAWNDVCIRYNLPFDLVCELLAGVAMDLSVQRYETFAELWVYCYRVASVVGLISMRVIGYQPGAEAYAIRLGIALQLTNILRDVGEDAARGRIYLPLEDLRRFGITEQEILDGVNDERFHALMRFEIERAEALYRASWPGILLLNRDGQLSVAAAALLYRGILGKIVENEFDVVNKRACLSASEKLIMLPAIHRKLQRLRRGDQRLVR
jgi:phytoene synthase